MKGVVVVAASRVALGLVRVPAVALALSLACAGCHKDFDGLFTGNGAGSSGDDNKTDSTSGSNGTSGDVQKPVCTCPACNGSSCSFTCPANCKFCECDAFKCPAGDTCKVDCGPATSCDVTCPDKTLCKVNCADDAMCLCTGSGCDLTCTADKSSCSGSGERTACNRECPTK